MAVYGQFVWPYGKFHVISIQQCIQYPVAIPLEYDEREHKIVKLDSVHFHIQWKQIRQTNTKWSVCRFVRTYTINSGCDTLEYQGCALYDCYESHIYIYGITYWCIHRDCPICSILSVTYFSWGLPQESGKYNPAFVSCNDTSIHKTVRMRMVWMGTATNWH